MIVLWCDSAAGVGEQMARDAGLLEAAERERGRAAVLRLFRFAPHGITLGRAQRPERELDLARCEADRVAWAVRPTGGRAIFHAEEWTCSLCARIEDPTWGGSPSAAYERVARLLVASLARLGVPARLATGTRGAGGFPRAGVAAPCFASTGRAEIVLDGGKLAGSAMRRGAGAFLQQTSLLLGDGHLRLADYLALDPPSRGRLRGELARASRTAARWLGTDPPLGRWVDALAAELPDAERVEGDSGRACLLAGIG